MNGNLNFIIFISFEFNKIIPLDKWKLNVLNKVKENM